MANTYTLKRVFIAIALVLALSAQAKEYILNSPDNNLSVTIDIDNEIKYAIKLGDTPILAPSTLSMTMADGTIWGQDVKIKKAYRATVNGKVASPFYRSDSISENYNSLSFDFAGQYGLEFRAYNDGVAYRFNSTAIKSQCIASEDVIYNLPFDATIYIPYAKGRADDPFFNSFENEYTRCKISQVDTSRIAFLPLTIDLGNNIKLTLTESDLQSYPGLYLKSYGGTALSGVHARYPKAQVQGGHNNLQMIITEREDYIAKTEGSRTYPWRIAIVTDNDKNLAETNLSYLLASPSRIDDISWIKPGKVAWDWWNAWNITGVDFVVGINTNTYKSYIDFAAANDIEYVILDEGWAVNKKSDLMQIVPEIDLADIIKYASDRGVGIVLWAGYTAFDKDMENVCRHYASMGIKGFKVDFMDRDDQQVVDFIHRAAETSAKYRLFLDLHGMYKPAGLNRTYPNILNFEGVNGLEQMKWSGIELDQVKYDVTIPFIRQVSGPMDYTPGAMLNGTRRTYRCNYTEPMSQGTRCHQLAMFVIYDAPFEMLCDTPINYDREPQCRDYIADIPTTWNETIILDAMLGEYIVTARRKGEQWWIAGMTDWTPRDLTIDLSFLPDGEYSAEIFSDGTNASQHAHDYRQQHITVTPSEPLTISLAPGGGFAMRLKRNPEQ